jgi:hypothetical protein
MATAPDQPHKITLQVPQGLIAAMKAQAKKHRRSFTGEVVWALERYIAEREREEQAQP